jgi:SAM-dependent methyltransferase
MRVKKNNININFMNNIANQRDYWIQKNPYYHFLLKEIIKFNLSGLNPKILEIGSGTGFLLNSLTANNGTGIDISEKMVEVSQKKYPNLNFIKMDAEKGSVKEKFEYIILSDTIGYLEDIQNVFSTMHNACNKDTRIIINSHNFLWKPILTLSAFLKLKMPNPNLNWLNSYDIKNLLDLSGFEVIKETKHVLCPIKIPVISYIFNKFLAKLPIINKLCLVYIVVARSLQNNDSSKKNKPDVSVIIPAQNEKDNIENAIKRMPRLGSHTEIIFIEGCSNDGTYDEIKRVAKKYCSSWDIKYAKQDNKGKADAVWKGFHMAQGEILMILDSDLTVMPEDLVKFYDIIATNKGEYIQGTRLVYPMKKEAMRTLNLIVNKIFSLLFSWLLDRPIRDTLCGTKVISNKNWQRLYENRLYFGDFDPFGDFELLFGAYKLNLKFVEIPIRYKARVYGNIEIKRFTHGVLLLKMFFFALKKIKFA